MELTLPYNWTPRHYQLPLLRSFDNGKRRFFQVWHRRAGKDLTDWQIMIREAVCNKAVYWYIFPTYKQGKKAIWEGMTKDGRRYLDFIPPELIKSKNDTELRLELINGSIIRIIGGDKYNNIVGAGPKGVILSEFALQKPELWDYIEPMLIENGGWAIINTTPRGENHAYDFLERVKELGHWHVDIKTVDDTKAVAPDIIQQMRLEGKSEDIIQQEYYCSFRGAIQGSYYSDYINALKDKGQITGVAYDPILKVDTYWDLGVNDSMVIWFMQTYGNQLRIIDYYENHGEGLQHYITVLDKKEYNYGRHFAPHDIHVRELGTGKSRIELARQMGINFMMVPNLSMQDGIEAVRAILPRCWFDAEKCKYGIQALKQYRKDYDEKRQVFRDTPLHDWSSHAADAFRYLAVGHRDNIKKQVVPQRLVRGSVA